MLIIREQQIEVLSQYMVERFEIRMFTHFQTTFPDKTKHLETRTLKDFIKTGIEKAKTYKVVIEEDVKLFLECMMNYGVDFDIDVETGWASDILLDKEMDASEKMDRIYDYIHSLHDS